MITVDFHPRDLSHASTKAWPADNNFPGFVTLQIGHVSNGVTIYGRSGDLERFEKIAALLNESFDAQRPERPVQTPADLAGDYLGAF